MYVFAVGEGLAPPVSPEARPTLTGGDKPRPYGARKPNVHAVGATLAVARIPDARPTETGGDKPRPYGGDGGGACLRAAEGVGPYDTAVTRYASPHA